MQFGPMCKLATTPGKTSEMLKILKHMGVTAYGPRQRGNLQNPLPLFLTFSAEEKWWTKYASSEVPASNKPWAAVRRSQDKCKRYHMFWHWHGLDKCLLCTGKLLQLKSDDSMINDQLTFATKGEKCTGITDSINVTNAMRRLVRTPSEMLDYLNK